MNAGQQVTYTATVTNTGDGSDPNAGFQDLQPNNTTLVTVTTSQGTCSGSPTIQCNLGALDRGASATITIVVTANQAGRITDRAWVSTNPPGHWDHQHSVDTQVQPAPSDHDDKRDHDHNARLTAPPRRATASWGPDRAPSSLWQLP